uniref:Death domain-containing protein n=1 Tax=Romanomermis culicivorax TaxID=13658 RepID=A0A915JS34_ROMCU
LSQLEDLNTTRITRILTNDFPQYFAIITRYRQEVHAVGADGGVISSTVVPKVQAVFPEGALTKTIRVSLQANNVPSDVINKLYGNRVTVSPVVTVEPRRRKFHKPITLVIPLPAGTKPTTSVVVQGPTVAPLQDMSNVRLLCSITGGTAPAQWEDITGTTQLTFNNDAVSFTTTVSARFWLMDCQNARDAARIGQEIYADTVVVPYMAKFVVFARRSQPVEGQLRVFCMTDDKEDKTLERQEHYTEIAKSRDVEVLAEASQFLEFFGNLLPVNKTGDQLQLKFLRETDDPEAAATGRIAFMGESKSKADTLPFQQQPICTLSITLPRYTGKMAISETERPVMSLERKYRRLRIPGTDTIYGTDIRVVDVSNKIGLSSDWSLLAHLLRIPDSEIDQISREYTENELLTVFRIWLEREGPKATSEKLAPILVQMGRQDVVQKFFKRPLAPVDYEKLAMVSDLKGETSSWGL